MIPDFKTLSDTAFSVHAAARDCPSGLALIDSGRSFSYAELDALVQRRLTKLELPGRGRPYILKAENNLETFVTIYALLEAKIPLLLLHPKLTQSEEVSHLKHLEAIQAPVPQDTAVILLTSGTTGNPKPAMLSRAALAASAYSSAQNIVMTSSDRWLMSLSSARIGGFSILTRSLMARSTVVLAPHFSATSFASALEKNRITLASIVPTMLAKLLDELPEWKPPEGFRTILLGGARASPLLLARARNQGIPIITTYGMTETASNVVTTPYDERFEPAATARANALVELKVEEETLRVRGPMCMSGYWGKAPLQANAWFDTDDIAEIDNEGGVHIASRRNDIIVTGGENVDPFEVENVLTQIAGIREALVLGLPDETWGAIVTALLIASDDPIDEAHLTAEIRKRLSSFKCPRRIAWVSTLPLTTAGKPNRHPSALAGLSLSTLHYTAF